MTVRNFKAFTLLEVTIVILIVVTVSTMAVTKFLYVIERVRAIEAVNILHQLKDYQVRNKSLYGEYVGDGNITEFPHLNFDIKQLNHFDRAEVATDPLNVGSLYRSDGSYHLNITEQGVVYCEVDESPLGLCEKIGFKDIDIRNIPAL